jgi:asparagine synthase (glutamine-hydrolysing)
MTLLLGAFGSQHKKYEADILRIVNQKNCTHYQTKKNHYAFIVAGQHSTAFQADTIHKNKTSIFIGTVFDRQKHKPLQALQDSEDIAVICKQLWGRYVGVSVYETSGTINLVRDLIGLNTLFYCVENNTLLFATELALLYDILQIKPSIQYDYFIEHLINKQHATDMTPFVGIKELLPGMILSMDDSLTENVRHLWQDMSNNPVYIDNHDEFEHTLFETLKRTTAAWTEGSSGICVQLSGGADSSGLTLLLREVMPTNKKLVAVNFIDSKTPSSNEHQFAKDIADRCNASLHFIDWQDVSLLDPLPSTWRPDRPSTFLLYFKLSQQIAALARETGCSQIMNGQGGDHVFLAPAPPNALEDQWIERGVRGSLATLKELSTIYRMPWWPLLYQSMKGIVGYYRGSETIDKVDTSFLAHPHNQSPSVGAPFYLHQVTSSLYPGHASRIKNLFHGVAYAERNQWFPDIHITHPLFSQPLIELAFKIPTYQSFQNGYDRIFFRKAVSKLTQSDALWRHIKGETTGSMLKACAHSADEIESLIMNGELVHQGIINTEWFSQQFIKIKHSHNDNLWPILHMITSQLWFNQWKII